MDAKSKRKRGVFLTTIGNQKLKEARCQCEREHNFGDRYTIEALSEVTGLAPNTINKIFYHHSSVDKSTLDRCFISLGATLDCRDYQNLPVAVENPTVDACHWGEAPDVSVFYGRDRELQTLTTWIERDRCRLVSVVGMGGIGKTFLTTKLAHQLQSQFNTVCWRSLRNAPTLSCLLPDLIQVCSQERDVATVGSTNAERISQLLHHLQQHRCLLILDNVEAILDGGTNSIPAGNYRPTYAPVETMLEFPNGSVALDSPFYVERPPIESDCYKEILKPGSLIRIRGPRQTGKTSLLNRVMAYAVQNNYQIVRLNLQKADKSIFTDLNKLLRWVCLNASRQLNLVSNLDEYWDEEIGSKVSCTVYFQAHILEKLETNLVVSFDEVDTIFNYPDVAEDFLALLREWHEEATIERSWRKLRLAIAHSTEVYIPLNVNQSPFNVGVPFRLPQFNPQQVQNLAQLHRLTWTIEDSYQLMAMVGGHPYLIRLALYHLARQDTTLGRLLQTAPTHAGVYSDHLRRCLSNIKQQSELASALKQVVSVETPLQLQSSIVYQLDSMGLIYLDGNQISPSCELYRQYFNVNL